VRHALATVRPNILSGWACGHLPRPSDRLGGLPRVRPAVTRSPTSGWAIARHQHDRLHCAGAEPVQGLLAALISVRRDRDSGWDPRISCAVIQDGIREVAMARAVVARADYTAGEVRRLQSVPRMPQARRRLEIAALLDGALRTEAIKIGGKDRQGPSLDYSRGMRLM
jgi:hypothetical protein